MADATQLKPRRRAGRFWLGLITILVWLLFGASVFLEFILLQKVPPADGLGIFLRWGGLRVYWVDWKDRSLPTRPNLIVGSHSLLWYIWSEPDAISWRYVFIPTVTSHDLFGEFAVDVNLPLWIPAVALLAIYVYMKRRDRRHNRTDCTTCGYDLTGNTSGRCPECGSPTRKSPGVEC